MPECQNSANQSSCYISGQPFCDTSYTGVIVLQPSLENAGKSRRKQEHTIRYLWGCWLLRTLGRLITNQDNVYGLKMVGLHQVFTLRYLCFLILHWFVEGSIIFPWLAWNTSEKFRWYVPRYSSRKLHTVKMNAVLLLYAENGCHGNSYNYHHFTRSCLWLFTREIIVNTVRLYFLSHNLGSDVTNQLHNKSCLLPMYTAPPGT